MRNSVLFKKFRSKGALIGKIISQQKNSKFDSFFLEIRKKDEKKEKKEGMKKEGKKERRVSTKS